MALPPLLFRGDRDDNPAAPRQVRQLWHLGYLRTNLVNGNAIWSKPLVELVRLHVAPGWLTTHFLSFSEDGRRAEAFAKREKDVTKTLVRLSEDAPPWDTAIFTLDLSRCLNEATKQVRPGLWITAFEGVVGRLATKCVLV